MNQEMRKFFVVSRDFKDFNIGEVYSLESLEDECCFRGFKTIIEANKDCIDNRLFYSENHYKDKKVAVIERLDFDNYKVVL